MPDHEPTNPTGKNRNQPGHRWTAADTDRMRQLHADGMSCNGIAREMGFNPQVISRRCREDGLSFDRSRVEAANIARSVDAKARRQAILDKLYDRAEGRIDALNAGEWRKLVKGEYGSESEATLKFVPADDERHIASSVTSYLTGAAKLEALDADNGNALGRSLLEGLAAAFGIGPVDHGDDADPA